MSTSPPAALQITKHCRLMTRCYAGITSSGDTRTVIITLVDQSCGMVATAPAPATTALHHGIITMMESPGHGIYTPAVTSPTEYITWAPPVLTQDSTCRFTICLYQIFIMVNINQKTGSHSTLTATHKGLLRGGWVFKSFCIFEGEQKRAALSHPSLSGQQSFGFSLENVQFPLLFNISWLGVFARTRYRCWKLFDKNKIQKFKSPLTFPGSLSKSDCLWAGLKFVLVS